VLDSIKEGDKVKFAADKVNGAITVTAIETAKRSARVPHQVDRGHMRLLPKVGGSRTG